MRLAQEFLRAIGHEVNTELILKADLLAIAIVDRAFIGVRRKLKLVGAFPHIEKASAVLGFDVSGASA